MSSPDAFLPLMRLVNGFQVSAAISAAATLGIADLLVAGPRSSDDLAAATGTHPRSLYRLLRALAAVGVFHEDDERRFALTPMSECLRSDAPVPAGPWAEFIGRPYFWNTWNDLLYSVRTGENAFLHRNGIDVWEYRKRNPEDSRAFNHAMEGLSRSIVADVVRTYDFTRFAIIVDVAGGTGAMLAGILRAHESARGIVFDLPHVVEGAPKVLAAAGVADRCEIVGGDFFTSVPRGDALILKAILHDWDDKEATAILRCCRDAIAPDGKLLVLERVVAPPNQGPEAKFGDLMMHVLPGGLERTVDEFVALFATAGFRLTNSIPTGTRMNVIEAEPV
ncbi:MAG: acetylserotonin O-methyltransferase [Candidatus Eremiobacteraeota bacterium]|nr:acetylserotonin O-methyltransferase [Candidatus Eremiobacteraeota bacterium]